MLRNEIRSGVAHVGVALKDPAGFAVAWNDGTIVYRWPVWIALLVTAIIGTTTYGMTMGLLGGASDIILKGFVCTMSAGLAWVIALPALYILNSLSGSRLSPGSTVLAALVTVSWGGLAMLASIPINWFFTVSIPHATFILCVNLVVFTGVGISMTDVFIRVMRNLEPTRKATPVCWLYLVGAIGTELFYYFGLFEFTQI